MEEVLRDREQNASKDGSYTARGPIAWPPLSHARIANEIHAFQGSVVDHIHPDRRGGKPTMQDGQLAHLIRAPRIKFRGQRAEHKSNP